MEFDPTTALAYARAIARPRLVGSGEDKVVAAEISSWLEGFGYQVERQSFRFSTALAVFITAEIIVSSVLIAAAFWLRQTSPWTPALPAVLLLVLILLSGRMMRAVEACSLAPEGDEAPSRLSALCLRLGSLYETENLIATLRGSSSDAHVPHLYLVAHYDSKSQRMPLVVRIVLFVIAIAGGLIFAALTLATLVFPALAVIATVIGIVTLLAGLPLIFLDVSNVSAGAIDDASGVGVVAHLAEVLAQHTDWRDKLKVTVLITSAEELAVMGAAAYVHRHEQALRHEAERGGVHIFNFDGPGVDGNLYLVEGGARRYTNRLPSLIRTTCAELKLPIGRFAVPGALFDHIPFARRGFDAVSLIAIGKATLSIHTRGDSADKLHVRGFDQAAQVALRVIEKLVG